MKYTYGTITALVVYNTNYYHPNSTKKIQIEFGPTKEFAVNTILGIPTPQKWKASISFEGNFLPHPLFKHTFLLFKNLLTLVYLPDLPLAINNSSNL